MKAKKPITVRMSDELIGKLKDEADGLNIDLSKLVVAILESQLDGKKFSKIDYLVRKTFKGLSE